MVLTLYTSRVILNALGVEDYGVYNAVGGFISLFAILTNTLSAAISRLSNAMMENFFGLMKSELLYPGKYTSAEVFKKDLIEYIEYYNNERIKLR